MAAKRILISLPNWLGDIVMSLPTIKAARRLWPESHLSVLVHESFAPLFKYNQDINEVISYQRGKGLAKFISGLAVAEKVRRKQFDLAVILPRSFNSAFVTFLSKIPQRVGYAGDSRRILLTRSLPRDQQVLSQHRVLYFLNLLSPFSKSLPVITPEVTVGKEEDWVDAILKGRANDGSHHPVKDRLVIGFNAGATYGPAKCWLAERYIELARKLIDKFSACILLFGGPAEAPVNATIVNCLPRERVLDLAGRTDVLQLATLLKRCRILVTNDTGPMHLASAVGTPVVAIFGPTDPITTSPFGSNHLILSHKVSCSPCLKRTCPTDHKCMKLITVDEAFDACIKLIQGVQKAHVCN